MGDGLGLASATTTRNEGGARAHRRVSRAHAERIDGKFPRGLSDRGLDPVRLVVVHIGGRRSAAQRSADPIFESILGPTRTFLNCHGRVARGAPKFHRGPRAPVRSSSKPSRAGRSSTGRSFRYRHTTSTPPLSLSRCRPRRRARVAPRRLRVTPFRRPRGQGVHVHHRGVRVPEGFIFESVGPQQVRRHGDGPFAPSALRTRRRRRPRTRRAPPPRLGVLGGACSISTRRPRACPACSRRARRHGEVSGQNRTPSTLDLCAACTSCIGEILLDRGVALDASALAAEDEHERVEDRGLGCALGWVSGDSKARRRPRGRRPWR